MALAEAEASHFRAKNFPICRRFYRHSPTLPKYQLYNEKSLFCLVSAIVRNNQHGATQPCVNQTVSSV
jgi:hypothetical protein